MTGAARQLQPDPALVRILERCEIDVWRDLYTAAPPDVAEAAGFRVETLGTAVLLLAPGVDVLALNRLVGLGVDEPASEALLDEALAAAARAGVRRLFVQVVPTAAPPTLGGWLAARGLAPYNAWVRLARPVMPPADAPTALRVAEIGAGEAADFGRIAAAAFGWPPALEHWTAGSVGRERWRHYMAYDDDEPVATAAFRLEGEDAWFGFAATSESHRGRGAQSALLARRLRDAGAMGARRASLETAQPTPQRTAPSFRNVQRAGFAAVYLRQNWLHVAAPA